MLDLIIVFLLGDFIGSITTAYLLKKMWKMEMITVTKSDKNKKST